MGEQLGRREPAPSALDRPLASRLTWDHGADRGFPLRYRKGNSHRHPFLTAFSYLELVGDTQLGDQPSRRVASTPVSLAPSIAGRRPSPSSRPRIVGSRSRIATALSWRGPYDHSDQHRKRARQSSPGCASHDPGATTALTLALLCTGVRGGPDVSKGGDALTAETTQEGVTS